ncbi:MAG TPA: GNAT family N-acetyltransferase [Candidatus Limiplasma sp.]|nr:GNAT family N-acetyltransferase [Candidatus Limiplasma sp.]HPS81698.1 GNAT family N-acetyltransferase [Candidatus Limiplasma sp.]
MQIRIMNAADYDRVFALWLHTPGMGLNDVDDSREGIERYLRRNPQTCFVAENQDGIVGVMLSGHDGRRGFIHHAAVATEQRRQGIGEALTERVLEALRKEGITKVALVAYERNVVGNQFWESHGFLERTDLIYRDKTLRDFSTLST